MKQSILQADTALAEAEKALRAAAVEGINSSSPVDEPQRMLNLAKELSEKRQHLMQMIIRLDQQASGKNQQ